MKDFEHGFDSFNIGKNCHRVLLKSRIINGEVYNGLVEHLNLRIFITSSLLRCTRDNVVKKGGLGE